MKLVRVGSMAIFSALWLGFSITAAEAEKAHDHSGHGETAKMEEMQEAAAHVIVDSIAQHQIDLLVGAYLVVSDHLAHDRLDSLSGPLGQMSMAAKALAKHQEEHVALHAAKVASSVPVEIGDIKTVRASFAALSGAVIALVEKAPPSNMAGRDINKAYCPMKSAAWLQRGGDILNPYYGSEMASCGSIKNAIQTVHIH